MKTCILIICLLLAGCDCDENRVTKNPFKVGDQVVLFDGKIALVVEKMRQGCVVKTGPHYERIFFRTEDLKPYKPVIE